MPNSIPSKIERVRVVLGARARNRKYIQGDIVVDFISEATGYDRQIVLECLSELRGTEEIFCQNWYQGEPVGRLMLSLNLSMTEAHLRWLEALKEAELNPHDVESLEPLHPFVDDWEGDDLLRLIRGLIALREDMPKLRGHSRYTVSARYLLGSSKIIDALPNASLRTFGIDPAVLAKPPCYLMTAGPKDPEAILLIENPQAFEFASLGSIVDTVALVATFGYGLSRAGDDFGRQLASHIESNDPLISLVRKGSPPELETLLSHPKIYFWGDLDTEGLRIFWRLKSKLPQLKLSALYLPMIEQLKLGASHPYCKISCKANQRKWKCKDRLVDHLLKLCESRAVDQEYINPSVLDQYASDPLDWCKISQLLTMID